MTDSKNTETQKEILNPGFAPEWNLAETILNEEKNLSLKTGNSLSQLVSFLDKNGANYGLGSIVQTLNRNLASHSYIQVYDVEVSKGVYLSEVFNETFPHRKFPSSHSLKYDGVFSNIPSDVRDVLVDKANPVLLDDSYYSKKLLTTTHVSFHLTEDAFRKTIDSSYLPKPIILSENK